MDYLPLPKFKLTDQINQLMCADGRGKIWQRGCDIVSGAAKNLGFMTNTTMMTSILAANVNAKERQGGLTKMRYRNGVIVLNRMSLVDTDNASLEGRGH